MRHSHLFSQIVPVEAELALCGNRLEVAPRQSLGFVGATDGLARIGGDLALGERGATREFVTGIATANPGTAVGIVDAALLVDTNTKDQDVSQDIPCELVHGLDRNVGLMALAKGHVDGREVGTIDGTGLERLLGQIEFG